MTPNERYQEIKASIRVRGLETPLPITQRPGEALYTVSKGGNTRLAILNELYQETGERRFFELRCHFTPWVSEADTLLAHLTENDQRGELAFIDRARGVRALHTLLEQELGRALPLRELAARLKALGYHQDAPRITRMYYALETLLPALPALFASGMGRRQVELIRRLDRAAQQVWEELGIRDSYAPVFQALLQRFDGEQWDYDRLRAAVLKEIEVTADQEPWMVEAALARVLEPEPQPLDTALGEEEAVSIWVPPARAVSRSAKQARDAPPWRALRTTAFTVAARLAAAYGLAEVVVPCSVGYGYWVIDLPSGARPPADDNRLAQVVALWWHLAACCGVFTAPAAVITPPTMLPNRTCCRRRSRLLNSEYHSNLLKVNLNSLDQRAN